MKKWVAINLFLATNLLQYLGQVTCTKTNSFDISKVSTTFEEQERNFNALLAHHKQVVGFDSKGKDELISIDTQFIESRSLLITTVEVGTPSKPFRVVLDTGSTNCWIVSSNAHNQFMAKYDPASSSTYEEADGQLKGHEYTITFGTGKITLEFIKELVKLNGIEIKAQDLGLAVETEGSVFQTKDFDGLLGLGYQSLAVENSVPVFDRLMGMGYKSFAFSLYHNKFLIGDVIEGESKNYYDGGIQWNPVTEKWFWKIKLDDILVDGESIGLCKNGDCQAVIDSGTSFNTAPSNSLTSLLGYLKNENSEGCAYKKSITYVMNWQHYTLTPEDYVQSHPNSEVEACAPMFMQLDVHKPHGPAYLLGEVFMRKFYTVFDRENNRVGFAANKLEAFEPAIMRFNK